MPCAANEIGSALKIGSKTVETHLARLFGENRERIRIPLDEHLALAARVRELLGRAGLLHARR